MDTPSRNLRPRPSQMAGSQALNDAVPARAAQPVPTRRTSPYLPTRTELLLLAAYPTLLTFGALFSLVSPETRSAPYDALTQSHLQDPGLAPNYFARKDNLLNQVFVKRGWLWISAAFGVFVLTHPALASAPARLRAATRWAAVTAWWVFVTQWFFGPAVIDRGFRWSGGKCEVAEAKVFSDDEVEANAGDVLTAVACKAAGGRWRGGHDISGHVFMLVLGSAFLVQEVGWVVMRWKARREARLEERSIVMADGAVKGAGVESGVEGHSVALVEQADVLGVGGKVVAGVVVLSWWMILMTAIYFHTWFEKLMGLLIALTGLYSVYVLPRWVPSLRGITGLPGI